MSAENLFGNAKIIIIIVRLNIYVLHYTAAYIYVYINILYVKLCSVKVTTSAENPDVAAM